MCTGGLDDRPPTNKNGLGVCGPQCISKHQFGNAGLGKDYEENQHGGGFILQQEAHQSESLQEREPALETQSLAAWCSDVFWGWWRR